MQSKKFISLTKKSFRQLRKGESKFIKEFATESEVSWVTAKAAVDDLKSMGYLKETEESKLIINQDFKDECFLGVYISKNSINFSVIDFSGKELHFETQTFDDSKSLYSILKEKIKLLKGIKAVSICSDEIWIDPNGDAIIPNTIFLDKSLIEEILSKEIKLYFEKNFISNSWKCYEDYGFKDDEINVVISSFEDYYYYTICIGDKIFQSRKYPQKINSSTELYKDLIMNIWKIINPKNIIFISTSKEEFKFLREKTFEWTNRIYYLNNTAEQVLQGIVSTKLIATEPIHLSESAALYAMYRYYGWTK